MVALTVAEARDALNKVLAGASFSVVEIEGGDEFQGLRTPRVQCFVVVGDEGAERS